MRNIDRRQWLKSIGLAGTAAWLAKKEAFVLDFEPRSFVEGSPVNLNFNENPYGPSKKVRTAITSAFDSGCRYPFTDFNVLNEKIAQKEGVSKEHIVVTGGSTEGLCATGLTYGLSWGEIAADPTFQAMLNYAENFGAYVHRVPLNDKMEHDLQAMANRVTSKTRLIFICNPNNPTGTILDKKRLRDFCNSLEKKTVIFSDEAYYDFITEPDYPSMVELVKEGKNVIVSKTFSKVFGLAGLRIGYLIARPDIAERLRNNVMANTNVLAIATAKEALNDNEFYKFSVSKNVEAKTSIYNTLDSLKLSYIKSHTNFVFFDSGVSIRKLITDMKAQNVIIGRPFPPMDTWARRSTGTIEKVNAFNNALKRVLR